MSQTTGDALPLDPVAVVPVAGSAGTVPAWLHLAVAWSLALVAVIGAIVLVGIGVGVPPFLDAIMGASVGGALGLTTPLALTARA